MIAKSSFLFTCGTLISRITGLIRDIIIFSIFGASSLLDAFWVAYTIPNLFREMLAEGALGSSFTKVFSFLWEKNQDQARKLFFDTFYFMTIISSILCALGIVFAPYLVYLNTLFTTIDSTNVLFIKNTIGLTRILFPFLMLSILSAIAMGALNQSGRFFLSAFASVASNLGFIFGAIILSKVFLNYGPDWIEDILADKRICGLAVGVLIGGLLQICLELWWLWKPLLKGPITLTWRLPWSIHIKEILVLMAPMAIAASAGQINIVINTNFATSLETGSISWLRASFRLLQLPIGLFGVAIGAAVLPTLAKSLSAAGRKVNPKSSRELQSALELVLWLMVPCLIFLCLDSIPIIQLIYQYGKFNAFDTAKTAEALYAYSFGLIGYGLIKVLLPFYYAIDRTKYAMYVSLAVVGINFVGNYTLVNILGFKHQGLAFTSSSCLTFNALFLLLGLKKEALSIDWKSISKSLVLLLIGVILVVISQKLFQLIYDVVSLESLPLKVSALTKVITEGIFILIIFTGLGLLRLNITLKEAMMTLKRKK